MRPAFRSSKCVAVLLLAAFLLGSLRASAVTWGYITISDEVLAKYPIIVIAKWEKAPLKSITKKITTVYGNELVTEAEITDLRVIRVIRGDLQPGMHKLLKHSGTSWSSMEGDNPGARVADAFLCDVKTVAEPALWYLTQERSDDPTDQTVYLSLKNIQQVQQPKFEAYFSALGSTTPTQDIAKLLAKDEPAVTERILRLMSRDAEPWPYCSYLAAPRNGARAPSPLFGDPSDALKGPVERNRVAHLRGLSLALLADFQGAACVSYLRDLLHDRDPEIAHPSLKARAALHKLTGRWFPFDVEKARRGWQRASEKDGPARQELLFEEFPDMECPLKAELAYDGDGLGRCRITNVSPQSVTITELPERIAIRGSNFSYSGGVRWRRVEPVFITLFAGETTQFDLPLDEFIFESREQKGEIHFEYPALSHQGQKNDWVGIAKAVYVAPWKEDRKFEEVENRWPNGNLKAKGKSLNGAKVGDWHYFNFYGNRIRIENFTPNTKTKCDPEAPENEGAGRREKELPKAN